MNPSQKAKEIAAVIYTNIIEYGRQAMPPDWKEYSETTEGKALIGSVISGEDWISVKDREPKEIDGQILVTNGNGFFEIVWRSDEDGRYNKPHRFDENDWPVFRLGTFTHWQPLPEPPKIN